VYVSAWLQLHDAPFVSGPESGSTDERSDDRKGYSVDFGGQLTDPRWIDGHEQFKVLSITDRMIQRALATGLGGFDRRIANRDLFEIDFGSASASDGDVEQIDPESVADVGGRLDDPQRVECLGDLQARLKVQVFTKKASS
jgi:hypothetical protein